MKATREKSSSARGSRTRRLARISVFSALSVIGSFIHLPGAVQTVSFDSSPGFFAALYFGPLDGAVVSAIGHIATSIINGVPLGLVHLPIAFGLGIAGAAIGIVNRVHSSMGFLPAIAVGVAINTGLVVLAVPVLGWPATISFIPFLLLAAAINGAVAAATYVAVRGRLRS